MTYFFNLHKNRFNKTGAPTNGLFFLQNLDQKFLLRAGHVTRSAQQSKKEIPSASSLIQANAGQVSG